MNWKSIYVLASLALCCAIIQCGKPIFYSTSDVFNIGQEFVVRCNAQIDANWDKYFVEYYLKVGPDYERIGDWYGAKGVAPEFKPDSIEAGWLIISREDHLAGQIFEARIKPLNNFANGMYYCRLRYKIGNSSWQIFNSREWLAGSALFSKLETIPDVTSFTKDEPFSFSCAVQDGPFLGGVDQFILSVTLKGVNGEENEIPVGYWQGGRQGVGYFPENSAAITSEQLNVSSDFTQFEIGITPNSFQAEGQYSCSLEVQVKTGEPFLTHKPLAISSTFLGKTGFGAQFETTSRALTIGDSNEVYCKVIGPSLDSVYHYTVSFIFKELEPKTTDQILLGAWEYFSSWSDPKFTSSENEYVTALEVPYSPSSAQFGVLLQAANFNATGRYHCVVLVEKHESDHNQTDYSRPDLSENKNLVALLQPQFTISKDEFSPGDTLTANCNFEWQNLNFASVFLFNVYYYFQAKVGEPELLGFWDYFPQLDSIPPKFTPNYANSKHTLTALDSNFTNFQVLIKPNSLKAEGNYYCSLSIMNTEESQSTIPEPIVLKSNSQLLKANHGIQISIEDRKSSSTFTIGEKLPLSCKVTGTLLQSVHYYKVEYLLEPRDFGSPQVSIGYFDVYPSEHKPDHKFQPNPNILIDYFSSVTHVPDALNFKIQLNATSKKADGLYVCLVTIKEELDDPQENFIELKATTSLYSIPGTSAELSLPTTVFSLHQFLDTKCTITAEKGIDIENSYHKVKYLYRQFGSEITKEIATWVMNPPEDPYLVTDSFTNFALKRYSKNNTYPVYRVRLEPLTPHAQGSYFCAVEVQRNSETRHYYSPSIKLNGRSGNSGACFIVPNQKDNANNFTVGGKFSVMGLVNGPNIQTTQYYYRVSNYFTPDVYAKNENGSFMIGEWEVYPFVKGVYFNSNLIFEPYLRVENAFQERDWTFQLRVFPLSDHAQGHYKCKFRIINRQSNEFSYTKYTSSEYEFGNQSNVDEFSNQNHVNITGRNSASNAISFVSLILVFWTIVFNQLY